MHAENSDGIALVQVLIMSVMLTMLASGLLKMTFGNHMLASKVVHADRRKALAEACMAQRTAEWAGGPCVAAAVSCNFPLQNTVVEVTCPAGQANFIAKTPDF